MKVIESEAKVGFFPKRRMAPQTKMMLKLRKLLRDYRRLPIYVEVESDLVVDPNSYSTYYGHILSVYPDEIFCSSEKVWSRQDTTKRGELTQDDMDLIECEAPYELQKRWEMMDEKAREKDMRKWENNLPWKKCIIIYVGVPDPLREEVGEL